jgi:hypothetical protein
LIKAGMPTCFNASPSALRCSTTANRAVSKPFS